MNNRITSTNTNSSTTGTSYGLTTKGSRESDSLISGNQTPINTAHLPVEKEKMVQQLEKAIRAVQGPEKAYEISIHEQTHAIMVKVFDKQSGDLIREIPSEKLLDVAANMMELCGLIVDERA